MKNYFIYKMPTGNVVIAEEDGLITALCNEKAFKKTGAVKKETPVLKAASKQLKEYFEGKRENFDLPLSLEGTAFQLGVWQAMLKIPYGQTASYKDIAKAVANPKAVRAVGGANNKNPIFIIIPCHRVVGADGSLTGYGGGIKMKEYLLNLEKENI